MEAEAERCRQDEEKLRIEREQKALIEWELYQPPPPPQVNIVRLSEDDPPMAILADERFLPIAAEKTEELKALLDSLVGMDPPKILMANELIGEDASSLYVDDFRLEDPKESEVPADGDAAAVAPDGAAP